MPVSPEPHVIADHLRQLAGRERRQEVAELLRWRAELIETVAGAEYNGVEL